MSSLEDIPQVELGERLRIARESAKVTQANAAAAIEVARTTIVAIESGQRRVRMSELQKLAQMYGVSVNSILRSEAVHVDLEPRFRLLPDSKHSASEDAVRMLATLARAEVELENLLGVQRPKPYAFDRPLVRGDVAVQAEHDAAELRSRLGLSNGPVRDIVTILELELGVRMFIRPLDMKIAGLFAYDDSIGPCMLLNASHTREKRAQTAAHETGHMVSNRREPDIFKGEEDDRSREERYANTFARAFLTPARAVMQKFQDLSAGSDRLTRRHVILLSYYFGVSREAMVRRLEELKLTKKGTWNWFEANGGITDADARQVLGDLMLPDSSKAEATKPTTIRLQLLASEAHRKQLLSEGQLAQLLSLDRGEIRQLLDDHLEDGQPGAAISLS